MTLVEENGLHVSEHGADELATTQLHETVVVTPPIAMSEVGGRMFLSEGFALSQGLNRFNSCLCGSGAPSVQHIIVVELVAGSIVTSSWTGSEGERGEKESQETIHTYPIDNIPRDLSSPVRL